MNASKPVLMGGSPVQMVQPSDASTAAFLAIVVVVFLAFFACVRHAYRDEPDRRVLITASLVYGCVLAFTFGLAASGTLALMYGRPQALAYLGGMNLLAIGAALSPFGRRLAWATPYWALVLVQAFRLPLELVLHSWWEQGVVPVQITYLGDNFDIATGVLALVCGLVLVRAPAQLRSWLAGACSVVGILLLLRVMSIAARSLPGPFQSYDAPILLAFHAPYTWILPGCVSAALFFHVLLVRKLMQR